MSGLGKGNALVMQSGGCTPVINRSLAGVVRQSQAQSDIAQIWGAVHGLEGVLADQLVELGIMSQAEWNRIAATPAAALGSTRHKSADIHDLMTCGGFNLGRQVCYFVKDSW